MDGSFRSSPSEQQSNESMERIALAFAAILAFTDCNDCDSTSAPETVLVGKPSSPIMDPARWTIGPVIGPNNYSVGMPLRPSATDGWSFEFPPPPGSVHYVTTPAPPLAPGQWITITFEVQGKGRLLAVQPKPRPGLLRLHIQRAEDDWSGQGEYQHYRFWSRPIKVSPGTHTMNVPLDYRQWTSVFGKKDKTGFNSTVANAALVGFTFGHNFAGHGVYRSSKEPVRFILKDFTVQ